MMAAEYDTDYGLWRSFCALPHTCVVAVLDCLTMHEVAEIRRLNRRAAATVSRLGPVGPLNRLFSMLVRQAAGERATAAPVVDAGLFRDGVFGDGTSGALRLGLWLQTVGAEPPSDAAGLVRGLTRVFPYVALSLPKPLDAMLRGWLRQVPRVNRKLGVAAHDDDPVLLAHRPRLQLEDVSDVRCDLRKALVSVAACSLIFGRSGDHNSGAAAAEEGVTKGPVAWLDALAACFEPIHDGMTLHDGPPCGWQCGDLGIFGRGRSHRLEVFGARVSRGLGVLGVHDTSEHPTHIRVLDMPSWAFASAALTLSSSVTSLDVHERMGAYCALPRMDNVRTLSLPASTTCLCRTATGITVPGTMDLRHHTSLRGFDATQLHASAVLLPEFPPSNGAIKLGLEAFSCCSNLTRIDWRRCSIIAGTGTLKECPQLRSVFLPADWKEIPQSCCRGCPQLAEVELAHMEQLTTVAGLAFESCPALVALKLPASVIEIGMFVLGGSGQALVDASACLDLSDVELACDSLVPQAAFVLPAAIFAQRHQIVRTVRTSFRRRHPTGSVTFINADTNEVHRLRLREAMSRNEF